MKLEYDLNKFILLLPHYITMHSQQEFSPLLKRNLSASSIRLDNSELSLFSQRNLLLQLKKPENPENISESLDRYYFSSMLDTYQSKNKAIPNPVQILQKIRWLQKRANRLQELSNISSSVHLAQSSDFLTLKSQKLTKASSILTARLDSEIKTAKKLFQNYILEMGLANRFQLRAQNIIELINQFLTFIRQSTIKNQAEYKCTIQRISKEKKQLMTELNNFRHSQKLLESIGKQTRRNIKQPRYSQESIVHRIGAEQAFDISSIDKTERLKNSIETLNCLFPSWSNSTNKQGESNVPRFDSQSFVDLKLDSEKLSEYGMGLDLQFDLEGIHKIEANFKEVLAKNIQKEKQDKEKLIEFWKNYLMKVVDQYETDIQKLKTQIKDLKQLLELYQREINRANSFANRLKNQH